MTWYEGGLHPPRPAGITEEDGRQFRHRQEGVMYVGDKGILLAGFNGQNPRVYPPSPKYVVPPRQEIRPLVRSEAGAQPAQAAPPRNAPIRCMDCRLQSKGPAALTNFEIQAPVTGSLPVRLSGPAFAG
ncbi:MAG: hypothetical protein IPM55_21610 [Acidobacteria bacterium]|nr:hypothetical protein [Acidobacteriota bacterium]